MIIYTILSIFCLTITCLHSVSGQSLSCPAVRTSSGWLDLFPLPCRKHSECRVMTAQHLCCNGFCTKGIRAAALRKNDPSTTSSTTTTSTTTTTTSTTPSTTTTSSTTTTPKPIVTEAPRPFLQLLPIQTTKATSPAKKSAGKSQKLICPKQVPVILFAIPCENTAQCRSSAGADQVCCDRRCVKGVPAPRQAKQVPHQPLLGVIPRECPAAPLGELLFEVQPCKADADCWPRVCCPDGQRSYCRTARARLDLVPVANQLDAPVRMLEQYLQCTAPPQPDLFPQKCSSSVDCFPNLCCAEGGKKHCRPPQRSLLALLAGVGQRVGSTLGNLRQNQAQNNNL